MKDQRLMKKTNLFLFVVTSVLPILLVCNDLNRMIVEYGWGECSTLNEGISVGDCPQFDIGHHNGNYIAYPPSRTVILSDNQKIKQDFYEPLITSLDGISKNLPEEKRTKIAALDLSRTNINEISHNAAHELKKFPNLRVIVLPNEASAEQKKQNKKQCSKIIFEYIANPEKQQLIQQAERLR